LKTISVALDLIAKRILEELAEGPMNIDSIATACTGGATRMVTPRLVWLEGLGMIENSGAETYSMTPIGQRFLEILTH
jgi:DNA-binding HxlR family transcriptional regulator